MALKFQISLVYQFISEACVEYNDIHKIKEGIFFLFEDHCFGF